MDIGDRIRRIKKQMEAKKFYNSITAMSYEYSNKSLAETIKNKRDEEGEATFDAFIMQEAEVVGRALQVEMKKTGKALSSQMYESVKQTFREFSPTDQAYQETVDTIDHSGEAISRFLMATWKYGDELGQALGFEKDEIDKVKKDVADIYMPQENNSISQIPRLGSGMSV